MNKTKWPQGWLPIDTYAKAVDDIGDFPLQFDWESLRQGIIEQGGIRNSVLTAIAPNESSSLVSNTTNSVYPVRDTIMYKQSQKGNVLFIVPEYEKLKTVYQSAWDVPAKDIAEMYGLLTKFMDQGISCDEWLDYSKMEGGRLSIKAQMQFILTFAKLGGKSLYYLNSKTKSGESLAQEDSANEDDDGCEACKM
jgi:ribonucleoside-diphosphate reductase alpha chain